jgi:PHP domain
LKKVLLLTAALVAAVFLCVRTTLPATRLRLAKADDGTVAGLLHIHTNRSDGLGSPDEVAAAAARAGLKFIVFTDHGDATRTPDPPQYRAGVLCLDGVEISTNGGHYIAIDMPASPYPLGGEAADVVEDVKRLGGFGIAAHPDSPKTQLRWSDWTAPIDGVEVLNLDTSWRMIAAQSGMAGKRRLLTALLDYPFRPSEVLTSLIQPPAMLPQWAAIAAQRTVVILAGADAHAKLPLRNTDPQPNGFALSIPGYEPSFRVMSLHARADKPLSNDATTDAALIAGAIRKGHLYTAIDGVAAPPFFSFTARNASGTAEAGEVLSAADGISLHVQSNAPPGSTTVVHDGVTTLSAAADTQDLTVHGPSRPGVFWVEIISQTGTPPITWIRSNPIYVRGPAATSPPIALPSIGARLALFDGTTVDQWRTEHDPNSVGAVELATAPNASPELRHRFGLAGGDPVGQVTALVRDLPNGVAGFDRIALALRAERPMRISLQVRDTTADRWQRSLYVDTSPQERIVALDDLIPVGVTHVPLPARDAIRALMLVIDTTNTKPETSGRIWLQKAELQRTSVKN